MSNADLILDSTAQTLTRARMQGCDSVVLQHFTADGRLDIVLTVTAVEQLLAYVHAHAAPNPAARLLTQIECRRWDEEVVL